MKFMRRLTAAIIAGGSLMAADALAAQFVLSGASDSPYMKISFNIYTYANNPMYPRDMPSVPACNGYSSETVPIMVVFGGGTGTGLEYAGLETMADKVLMKTCTRVIYVRQTAAEGYFANTGTANPANPKEKVEKAARNIIWEMDRILTSHYPQAQRVTYVGGSASAGLGAKVLELKFSDLVTSPTSTVPWSRVKRFVFAGPPVGNFATACRYTSAGSTFDAAQSFYTGKASCKNYLDYLAANNVSDTSGILYGYASESAKTTARDAGLRINMFIGTEDELFGWPTSGTATGPQGVENFMGVSNLWPVLTGIPTTAATASTHVDTGITYGTMSATHSNVWSRPSVVKAMCYLAAKETSSINPSAKSQYLARCDE